MVTPERLEKLKLLAARRQSGISVLLENVHDPHNIGAILRSCDAVGVSEVYGLYTIEDIESIKDVVGHRSSAGARKWMEIHYFEDTQRCVEAIRKKYDRILATYLKDDSQSLYNIDFTAGRIVLAFGNEHRGISDELLKLSDGNFIIPQYGLTQSLNISVACAVSLFEMMRQREQAGMYHGTYDEHNEVHRSNLENLLKAGRKFN